MDYNERPQHQSSHESDFSPEDTGIRNEKPKKKWPKRLAITLIVIIAIIGAVAGFAFYKYHHFYKLSNYVSDSDAASSAASAANAESAEEEIEVTDEEQAYLDTQEAAIEANPTLPNNTNVYNLLVIGVDSRDDSLMGNSDVMILLSINKETKTVHMISFMRDLYANVTPYGTKKMNFACAIGGPTKLVETLEENYKVNIDNYVCVNFTGVENIVDAVGGLDIEVSDEEAEAINGEVRYQCKLKNLSYEDHAISQSGLVHMDGMKALGYARIRHVGNADWQRTERQRTLLSALFAKVKKLSLSELNSTAETVLPMLTHNIESGSLLSLIASLPTFLSYDLKKDRVPYDGTYTIIDEILVPDMAVTISRLQQELYPADSASTSENAE